MAFVLSDYAISWTPVADLSGRRGIVPFLLGALGLMAAAEIEWALAADVTALMLLAVVVAVLGTVNTLVLSVVERIRELGLLRRSRDRRQVRTLVVGHCGLAPTQSMAPCATRKGSPLPGHGEKASYLRVGELALSTSSCFMRPRSRVIGA